MGVVWEDCIGQPKIWKMEENACIYGHFRVRPALE